MKRSGITVADVLVLIVEEVILLNSSNSKTKFIPFSACSTVDELEFRVDVFSTITLSDGLIATMANTGISFSSKALTIPSLFTYNIEFSSFLYATRGISCSISHFSAEKDSPGREGTNIVKVGIFCVRVRRSSLLMYFNKSSSNVLLFSIFLSLTNMYKTS